MTETTESRATAAGSRVGGLRVRTGVPETYYLDRRGRIVEHDAGQVEKADLERGIATAKAGPR